MKFGYGYCSLKSNTAFRCGNEALSRHYVKYNVKCSFPSITQKDKYSGQHLLEHRRQLPRTGYSVTYDTTYVNRGITCQSPACFSIFRTNIFEYFQEFSGLYQLEHGTRE